MARRPLLHRQTITEHTMIGHRGKLVEPLSESDELHKIEVDIRKAITSLKGQAVNNSTFLILREMEAKVQRLYRQVSAGYHRNPASKGLFDAGVVVGQIGRDVHDIRYTHSKDGKDYQHEFGGDAEVWAIERNGKRELLISDSKGRPMWDKFPE